MPDRRGSINHIMLKNAILKELGINMENANWVMYFPECTYVVLGWRHGSNVIWDAVSFKWEGKEYSEMGHFNTWEVPYDDKQSKELQGIRRWIKRQFPEAK